MYKMSSVVLSTEVFEGTIFGISILLFLSSLGPSHLCHVGYVTSPTASASVVSFEPSLSFEIRAVVQ